VQDSSRVCKKLLFSRLQKFSCLTEYQSRDHTHAISMEPVRPSWIPRRGFCEAQRHLIAINYKPLKILFFSALCAFPQGWKRAEAEAETLLPPLPTYSFIIQKLSQQLENGIGGRKVSGCPIREFVNNEGKQFSGMHNLRSTDILRVEFLDINPALNTSSLEVSKDRHHSG
jgi:hypothetical protein